MNSILLFILLSVGGDTTINSIKEKYAFINQHISQYRMITKIVDDGSEGTEVLGYFSKDSIKLIVENDLREMGKRRIEYYYDNEGLFFVYQRIYSYNVPFYDPEFNEKKSTFSEERYYFSKGKMIRYLKDKTLIDPKEFKASESGLKEESVSLNRLLRSKEEAHN